MVLAVTGEACIKYLLPASAAFFWQRDPSIMRFAHKLINPTISGSTRSTILCGRMRTSVQFHICIKHAFLLPSE